MKNIFNRNFLAIMMASSTAISANAASEGVKIEHLGVNNTLVRVESDGKYLMMPVQESNDDATVNVVVDGNLERTIFVRLAKSKVDLST